MRLWGDSLEALRIASGTIYNEVDNPFLLRKYFQIETRFEHVGFHLSLE